MASQGLAAGFGDGRAAGGRGAVVLIRHSPPNRTERRNWSNADFCFSTASIGPVILKNQVRPPVSQIAPTIRLSLPVRTSLPLKSTNRADRPPTVICLPSASISVADISPRPTWPRQRLTLATNPPAPPPIGVTVMPTLSSPSPTVNDAICSIWVVARCHSGGALYSTCGDGPPIAACGFCGRSGRTRGGGALVTCAPTPVQSIRVAVFTLSTVIVLVISFS